MKRKIVIIVISLTILSITPVIAGKISSELLAEVENKDNNELISVLIRPASDNNYHDIKADLTQNYSKRADRNRYGIARLKATSENSQKQLTGYLKSLERDNLAANIKNHWIIDVIAVDIMIGQLGVIAERNDVAEIFRLPEIKTIVPVNNRVFDSKAQLIGPEDNLRAIGADVAWGMGFDGSGRVVCSFDTGVNGDHPALVETWRGKDSDSSAAWFDPIDQESAPHTYSSSQFPNAVWHGSHVTGIMVGRDEISGDTIGVAPGAQWISAAVIDIPGTSIIDAFEWAVNPDGDPNTSDDIPDVINHSWGIENEDMGCDEYFWAMIDNSEALGIVNIFAAGNSGGTAGDMTITNPANRATDALSGFCVGALAAITATDTLIAAGSSRGPSDCDGSTIKPNVVAPGTSIRSAFGSTYAARGGTSMSAPHVSGAVAILRQVAPDATADEIKQALIDGCSDIGQTLPDNNYGYGLINIPASIAILQGGVASLPDIRVYSYDVGDINPSETALADVVLINRGGTLDDVYARISGGDGVLTYTIDSLHFGTIGLEQTAAGHIQFDATVSDTVTPGSMLSLNFDIYGSGGYNKSGKLYIKVGSTPQASFYTHSTGRVDFTDSNFGHYGFASLSFYPLGYSGFTFDGANYLYNASFMVGADADHVSDAARNPVPEPDNDFAVAPGGEMLTFSPGGRANQESWSVFNDAKAENPIGLEISQKTLSWDDAAYNQFVILEYVIKNISESTVNNLYAGLYLNWDANGITNSVGEFSAAEDLGVIYYKNPSTSSTSHYRGTAVLSSLGATSHKVIQQPRQNDGFMFLPWSEAGKYAALSGGVDMSVVEGGSLIDLAHLVATGPFNLSNGQSDTATFALIGADNLIDLKAKAVAAKTLYDLTLDVEEIDIDILPDGFVLAQNYPNPFNPSTIIKFSIPLRSQVDLTVYNLLGQEVIKLVDCEMPAGNYQTSWDGRDKSGAEVSSGIYFYRLNYNNSSLTRKMILLK